MDLHIVLLIILFLATGTVVGMLSALFGLGGGVVVVPVLYWFLRLNNIGMSILMHIAVGTSLAIMLVTTANSIIAHARANNIQYSVVKAMGPLLIVGSLLGALIGDHVHSNYLRYLFEIFMLVIIIRSIVAKGFTESYALSDFALPKAKLLYPLTLAMGLFSTMLGIGGSVFSVPLLRNGKMPMLNAAATAVALTPFIAIVGTLGFLIIGLKQTHLPPHSIGFIYWPAWLGIAAGTFIGVPIGKRFGEILPDHLSAKIYIGLLIILLIAMLV